MTRARPPAAHPCYRRAVLAARSVPVAPDPIALARGLVARGHQHVALLHSAGAARPGWDACAYLAADPDDATSALDPHASGSPDPLVSQAHSFARAPRWIGVIPYEARREQERPSWIRPDTRPPALLDRPEWLRYPAVARVDPATATVLVIGESPRAAERLAAALRLAEKALIKGDLRVSVDDDEPPERHADRIAAARELILAGDLYQVNLARRLRLALSSGSPFQLHERLARAAHAPFAAYLDLGHAHVLSTSPELLLAAEPRGGSFGRLTTEPIKGTRPRGPHAEADRALALELDADPKERAELAMIVDVERNDLGRVAETGTVRITAAPHVVTHRTIHHRVARVTAMTREGASRDDVLRAMLPSGSVTGAPKVRAMEVIASLEARRRGLYTGGLGFVRHDGGLVLGMAIRTVVFRGAEGEYWTGGGIVADSDPSREVEETRWKSLQLTRAVAERFG